MDSFKNPVKILDSVYTVEPSKVGAWNEGHWNYQWDGRSRGSSMAIQNFRNEGNGIITVRLANGEVWQMGEEYYKQNFSN